MGSFSIWHWLIVALVVLIFFGGKGKIATILGELGKGLKNFKSEINNAKTPKTGKNQTKSKKK